MLSTITKECFDKYINSKFLVFIDEDTVVELELIEIRDKSSENIEGFSLIFVGPSKAILSDNTYMFKHDKMGNFPMFISPFRQKKDIVYYDVQFTRLKDEED
ncbi:DUF6916 family protein [Clostridium scatologenes]|uniref:DUF6916 domain-containing protein n=1 Tax=Clostridium scatologenes TaxID=1548 RepID=A0A0E3GQP0_CLOSL|nr:hypothetical protein [Clostridium scatologenes]AKA68906.1 hypothetical protein CSCA_1781 [Clostridium scatologenes]